MPSTPKLRLGALFFHFDHLSSFPLTSRYALHEGPMEKWATIGGKFLNMNHREATDYFAGRGLDRSVLMPRPESESGPGWWEHGKYYLAYGVDLRDVIERGGKLAWCWPHVVFKQEDPEAMAMRAEGGWPDPRDEYLEPVHRQKVLPALAYKIKKDLGVARDLVLLLDGQGVLGDVDVDLEFTGDTLLQVVGEVNALTELRRTRRVMDERLAAINYGTRRVDPRVRAHVELKYAAYIAEWRLLDHGVMRGIYLDLRTLDPNHIPILDFLSHQVPIYYPISEEFIPSLTEDETHALEAISTAQEFAYLFKLACYPDVDKSLQNLHPVSIPSTPTLSNPAGPTKDQRRTALYEYAVIALADLLHNPPTPTTSPLSPVTVIPIPSARLIVDSVTELRMALWALGTKASTASEVIKEAVLRGWPFQIAYPEVHLEQLRVRPADPDLGPDKLEPLVVSTLSGDLPVHQEWALYLKRVRILLSRPNAKAFLYLGGIFWRLAILFGGEHLESWKRDIIGATSSAAFHRGEQTMHGHWSNTVTEFEKNVLLGVTRSRHSDNVLTWFPPPELLVKRGYEDGEWNSDLEYLVMGIFSSLQRGETKYAPMRKLDWEYELLEHAPGKLLRRSYVPPGPEVVKAVLADVRAELGGSWNGATMESISLSL